jgi:hypothetical protein
MVDLSLSEQDELIDMLWNISRSKHPNMQKMALLMIFCLHQLEDLGLLR